MSLLTEAWYFTGLCFLLGLAVGSFLNVVIYRLPKMMERDWQAQAAEVRGDAPPAAERFNICFPASHCPQCKRAVRLRENIPLLSYAVLLGRCAGCKTRIGIRYPLVELLTGLASGYTAWHFGWGLPAVSALVFVWAMIALTFIDFDTQLLPDAITMPLLWLGVLLNIEGTFVPLESAVIGAVAGYLTLWSVYWLFKLTTGKEGMGFGDFKLLAAIGAWLGWEMLPIVVLLSSFVGALVGVVLIVLAKHGRNVPIPFGPYLAAAGLICLFWGQALKDAYLSHLL
jgi:leader peptidase (prepilin peptidase) / N-methyltransferase